MKRFWLGLFFLMMLVEMTGMHHVYADNDGLDVRRDVIYGVSIEGATLANPSWYGGWYARIWEYASSSIVTIGYRWWSAGQFCYNIGGYTLYLTYPGYVRHYDNWVWNGDSYEWVGCTQSLYIETIGGHEFGHCNAYGQCNTKLFTTHARFYR